MTAWGLLGAGTKTLNATLQQTTWLTARITDSGGGSLGTAYLVIRRTGNDLLSSCSFINGAASGEITATLTNGITFVSAFALAGCSFEWRSSQTDVRATAYINGTTSGLTVLATSQASTWSNGYISNFTIADGREGVIGSEARRQFTGQFRGAHLWSGGSGWTSSDFNSIRSGGAPAGGRQSRSPSHLHQKCL